MIQYYTRYRPTYNSENGTSFVHRALRIVRRLCSQDAYNHCATTLSLLFSLHLQKRFEVESRIVRIGDDYMNISY